MVRVERNLKTLDLTETLELLLEVNVLEVLWHISHEHVVGEELLFVGSEQLLVELEGSALLSFNLEVLHGLACFVESDWVLDADDSRVEWGSDVLLDLGFLVKKDVGFFLEGDGDLSGISLVSWKVVEIDEVLLLVSSGVLHLNLFFVFDKRTKRVCLFFVLKIINQPITFRLKSNQ